MNPNDSELIMLALEKNEEAENTLYQKYSFVLNSVLKKYKSIINILNLNYQDVYNECLQTFDTAIKNYDFNKEASFKTFSQVLIERKLKKIILKASRIKNKIITQSIPLDFKESKQELSIEETIKDSKATDPLINLTMKESINELEKIYQEELSKFEYNVLMLLLNELNYHQIADILQKSPKQVDNAIQRIKAKLKDKVLKILEI